MHFIKNFSIKTLKYDLVNKFIYKTTKKLPRIKKITLNFRCLNIDIKHLIISLSALEFITNQKSQIMLTKHSNMLLRIKKGNSIGCKVTLRKKKVMKFFSTLLLEIFTKLKNFNRFKLHKKTKQNVFSYELQDIFSFKNLEKYYYLFNFTPSCNITVLTNVKTKKELLFILNSFKFPFK